MAAPLTQEARFAKSEEAYELSLAGLNAHDIARQIGVYYDTARALLTEARLRRRKENMEEPDADRRVDALQTYLDKLRNAQMLALTHLQNLVDEEGRPKSAAQNVPMLIREYISAVEKEAKALGVTEKPVDENVGIDWVAMMTTVIERQNERDQLALGAIEGEIVGPDTPV